MPNFISTFAGIGGFDRGLELAGWTCVGQVEIDPFCQQVLTKHWPDVPKHNDIRTAKEWWLSEEDRPRVDLVCGGFPCQDVSVAGKRAGLGQLNDEARTRTGLFFNAMEFIAAVRPEWVLLENVPGLLTSNQGRDFGAVLDALVEGGHPHLEWRVLDSQHFGVPQRRRRVFVVGGTRDPRGAQVLFEPEGVRGDPAPSDEAGSHAAATVGQGTASGGRGAARLALDPDDSDDVRAGRRVGPLQAQGATGGFRFDADGAGAGHILPIALNPVDDGIARTIVTNTNDSGDGSRMTFVQSVSGFPDPAGTVTTRIGKGINTTLDDGAVITQERSTREEDRPRKRIIKRASQL